MVPSRIDQAFGTLLSNLGAQRGMPPAPLDSFKDGDGPVARLYNWNLLGPVLKPFGIVLDDNAKSLLVAGGAQTREQKNAIPIRLRRLSPPPPP